MENSFQIITASIILLLLLILSLFFQKTGKYTAALIVLTLVGLILRIFIASDLELHPWDERYHALVAKNLINDPLLPKLYENTPLPFNYEDWTSNAIWLHKQPFPLWIIAGSIKLFGVNAFAVRIPSILLSTGAILLVYGISKSLFKIALQNGYSTNNLAYYSAFLFAINGLILEITGGRTATDHVDLFFMFFILFAIWASIKSAEKQSLLWTVVVGMLIGCAILTKWLPALIVLPIWWLLQQQNHVKLKERMKGLIVLILVVLIVALPWQIYIYTYFPLEAKWESFSNARHLSETLDGQGGSFLYHFDKMRINFGELIYIPLIWLIWIGWKTKKTSYVILLIWIIIPYLFFSAAKTKMQAYTLFSSPALFITTGLFCFWLLAKWKDSRKLRLLSYSFVGLTILFAIRFSIERLKPIETLEKRAKAHSHLASLRSLETLPRKSLIFNDPLPIETMFFSRKTVYSFVPDEETLTGLKQQGYYLVLRINDIDDSVNWTKIWDRKIVY